LGDYLVRIGQWWSGGSEGRLHLRSCKTSAERLSDRREEGRRVDWTWASAAAQEEGVTAIAGRLRAKNVLVG
jgi:hypothetical protein